MRWQGERRSTNVEDRRGVALRRGGMVGGGAIIVAIVASLLGAPPDVVRSLLEGGGEVEQGTQPIDDSPETRERVEFVKVVLGSTEDVWAEVLPQSTPGAAYEPPRLVLFQGA